MYILIGILVLIVILAMYSITIKNKYVEMDNYNKEAWSNVKVYLQKRLDLIPNIVNTVKGYAAHEKETLSGVIEARNQMANINLNDIDNIEKIQKAEGILAKNLKSIMMLTENYPNLKADTSFLNLQNELSKIEQEVERSRKYFNGTSRELNIFTQKFPNLLFAGIFNFRKAELFEADEIANTAPRVEF